MDEEDGYLWDLEFWEHEVGKSWSLEELYDFTEETQRHIVNRLRRLKRKSFEQLGKSQDLNKIQGQSYLEITIPKNEIRIFGVIDHSLLVFYALHVFHKKSKKIKQKNIDLAIQRLDIFKKKKL